MLLGDDDENDLPLTVVYCRIRKLTVNANRTLNHRLLMMPKRKICEPGDGPHFSVVVKSAPRVAENCRIICTQVRILADASVALGPQQLQQKTREGLKLSVAK